MITLCLHLWICEICETIYSYSQETTTYLQKDLWTNALAFLWGFRTTLLIFVIQTIKLILNTLDTFYDFTVDMTESNNAMYLAISPCQSCYSLNSSPCRCSKYLYCDILCQIADGHQCNTELTFDDNIKKTKENPKILSFEEVFRCEICHFSSNSQNGVNVHKGHKHKSALRMEWTQV